MSEARTAVVGSAAKNHRHVGGLDVTVREHENVIRFVKTPWREWLFTCAELAIVKMPPRGALAEDKHLDGGASILHMSFTLYGKRRLRSEQGGDLPGPSTISPVLVRSSSTYFGTLGKSMKQNA